MTESLARWFAHHWHHPRADAPEVDYRIAVTCAAAPELAVAWGDLLPEAMAPEAEGATPVRVEVDGESTQVLLGSLAGGAFLEYTEGGVHVRAWGADEPDAPGRAALLIALHDAVRASGMLPLHCSAAVRPGEAGATAFLGRSGAGKSTTLLTAIQAGWAPVCEDFAWLDPGSLTLYAWDHDVRLLPDALERLGPLPDRPVGAAATSKRIVDYEVLRQRYGVERRNAVPLQRLVWLERGDGATRWTPLERGATVPLLWEAIGLPLTDLARRQVAIEMATLVNRVERATLHLGAAPWVPNEDR